MILTPTTLPGLKTLVRDLKAASTLRLTQPELFTTSGALNLTVLGQNAPTSGLTAWMLRELHARCPEFLTTCIEKQAGKKGKDKAPPLAGLTVGGTAATRTAFFNAVKVAVMNRRQTTLMKEGLPIAGVGSGTTGVTTQSFMNPLAVIAQEGQDVDLSAEAALLRLSRLRFEDARIHAGEIVKTEAEDAEAKAKTFAHEEVKLLPADLVAEVEDQEGLVLPNTANLAEMREAAQLIADSFLKDRVLHALAGKDTITDRERVYLHPGGTPAFTVKKSPRAGKWTPWSPTPPRPVVTADADSPFVGWSAMGGLAATASHASKAPTPRTVSAQAHAVMTARLASLIEERDRIAALMANALEDGDLRESAAYDEARALMFANEDAITRLEHELGATKVGEITGNIGATIELTMDGTPMTVTLTDGDPAIGQVSIKSPLGQRLTQVKAGDSFRLEFPVKTTAPSTARTVTPSAKRKEKRQTPRGVTAPILPDTVTTYEVTPTPIRLDTMKTVIRTVFVQAITP